jgi:hypothetical protein
VTNQSWKVEVPGSVLDAGVNLGLLNAGDMVSATVNPTIIATNTAERSQSAAAIPLSIGPVRVDAATGLASPLATSFGVPSQTWTATGGDISFAMGTTAFGVKIGAISVSFTCTPDSTTAFLMTVVAGAAPRVLGAQVTRGNSGQTLARTGPVNWAFAIFALALIDLGYLVASSARPSRQVRRSTRK